MNIIKKLTALIVSAVMSLFSFFFPWYETLGENGDYTVSADDGRQYVVFMITNIFYENLEPYLEGMVRLHGENDPDSDRMYAFGVVGPMTITQSVEEMKKEVNTVFALAEKYNIPVFFQMDDCTNYATHFGNGAVTDENGSKFYNDPEMCEWVAFPKEGESYGGESFGMLPRWHCDWSGVPFATAGGFPCFNSEKYLGWYKNQVTKGFIEPLCENLDRLSENGKEYLFAGVNTGWETQIPDYTDSQAQSMEDFERAQYGKHALYNLGYTQESLEAEAKERRMSTRELEKQLLYTVIADYIEFTCKLFYDAGIAKYKIFSHIVSLSSYTEEYSTTRPPAWVCINDYCTPGWTMSPKTCPFDLDVLFSFLGQNGRNEYVNAEGYAHYDNEETCREYFEESLGGNAKLITVFGYDSEAGAYGFVKSPDFYFVKVTNEWLSGDLLPEYSWAERPSLVERFDGMNAVEKLSHFFRYSLRMKY